MKKILFLSISAIFIFLFLDQSYSQDDKERVGVETTQTGAGYYNFGRKDKVNIEVNVWGFVKFPGKYLVPKGTTMLDLLSYSGGPTIETKLEEIRLYRPKNDSLNISKDEIITFNYNDILWEESINKTDRKNITLIPGDILIFLQSRRYFSRDNINMAISISSVLISLAILILTIVRK